ncbi:MAG: alpha/beta hydrolase [Actinobacteria bacterium]|nr:alpha/beta hydrolase [Actinomycetota bacterium]
MSPRSEVAPQRISFDSHGLELAADRWEPEGESDGTVLLLHGGGQTRHSWDRSAGDLHGLGWTVVTMDLRGHGESEWDAEGRYSVDWMAEDILIVCGELEAEAPGVPPVLVGASMGGLAALLAVGRRSEPCRALVLVDIALRVEPEGSRRIRSFMMQKPEGFESLEEAAAAIAAYNPNRTRPVRPEGLRKNLRLTDEGRWRWHWDPEILNQSHDTEDPEHPIRVRLREAARTVTVPTLLVRGLQSDVVSDEGLAEACSILPEATVVDVSEAGHMIAGDDNETFLDAIRAFLERL